MDVRIAPPQFATPDTAPGITRRDAVHRVITLMGGFALVSGDCLEAFTFDARAMDQAMMHGVGAFTAADIALLDEIAETILPETSTPGAKAAKTGAFIALMVTDAYTDANQQVFHDGLRVLDEACRAATNGSFMQASETQRLSLLEALDREQKTQTEERAAAARSRFPAAALPEETPAHYFRMIKELALLGYFTSEIGYTKAMRYVESPGRFDPDAPHAPGDKSWAPHA